MLVMLVASCGIHPPGDEGNGNDGAPGSGESPAEEVPGSGSGSAGAGDSSDSELPSSALGLAADDGVVFERALSLEPGETYESSCSTCTVKNGIALGTGLDVLNGVDLANTDDLGNGIIGPHYAPPAGSDLEAWLDAAPAMNRKVLQYLVECALPAGVEVQLLYRGELSTLGEGLLELGPSLLTGEMTVEEQEWVSACLIARQNGLGRTLTVELRGPHESLGETIPENDSQEAVFFGNLFAETPTAHVIHRAPVTAIRACADGNRGCGMVAPYYNNYTTTCGPYDGQTAEYCYGDGGYSTRVITVFFPSRPDGDACDYFMECDSLRCIDQVCTPRLGGGATCQADSDCDSGICDAETCTDGTVGDLCDGHWNCSTDYCGAGTCTEGLTGDPCDSTDDCRSGECKATATCK